MEENPTVCLVSAAYRPYPSGISEHVHHLAQAMRDLGCRVSILTTRFEGEAPPPDGVQVHRVGRAVRIPLNRSFATLPVGRRLPAQVAEFLQANRFDVVHCHGMFFPEIAYWAIRASSSVNVVTAMMAGFRVHTLGSGLYRRLFRCYLEHIHGHIAISRRARAAVEPYVPGRYRIIPSGVDLRRFRPDRAPRAEGAERPQLLFVGRLDRRKGLDVLIRALPAVLARCPAARTVVVGDGPARQASERLASELGVAAAIEFVGVVDPADLPRRYARADVYCSPAVGGESLGIVLLEAMAAGAPVVASDIPGYDETVTAGVDGLLVPPCDSDALASAVLTVLTSDGLAQRLREAGLATAAEYAWPTVAGRTVALYQELLAEMPARR